MSLKQLKSAIKKFPRIHAMARQGIQLLRAIKAVRIDAHELRETFISFAGGQNISKHDLRAFGNFLTHKVVGQKKNWLIVDVGAHDAWFIKLVHRFCSSNDCSILSFEPLPSKHKKLQEIGNRWPGFRLVTKAVGDKPGNAKIREYGSTGLSSIRPLAEDYKYQEGWFDTSLTREIDVDVITLDDELKGETERPIILKIDTQGFELQVLSGAIETLKSGRIKYVIVELMTVEKYKGAATYEIVFDLLQSIGFRLYDVNCTYYEESTGKMTEFDAFFELSSPTIN